MTVVRNFDRGAYDNLAAFSVKVKTIRGPWKRNVDNGAADASCAGQRNYEIRHAVSLSPLFPSFPFLDTIKCHFAKESYRLIAQETVCQTVSKCLEIVHN